MATAAQGARPGARTSPRVPRLEGIRALCAFGVLAVHTSFSAGVMGAYDLAPGNEVGAVLLGGVKGIILGPFFVLSGMLLYRPFARWTLTGSARPAIGPFLIKRVARLWPAYALLTVACLLLINYNSIHSVWYVLRPILMLQVYDFTPYAGMDPTWTVPAELQYYIALPLLAAAMHWLARGVAEPERKARRMMIPPVLLTLVGFGWTLYIHQPSMGIFPEQYWWPIAMAGGFALGMAMAVQGVLAEIKPDRKPVLHRWAGAHPNLFWLGGLAIYAINCAQPCGRPGYGDYESLGNAVVQFFLILIFSFLAVMPLTVPEARSRLIDAVLSNPVSRYLGRISFGIYLWHFAIMYFWFRSGSVFGGDPQPLMMLRGTIGFPELMTAVVLGSIAAAALSYHLVERPVLNAVDRWVAKRSAGAATAVAGTADTSGRSRQADDYIKAGPSA
ncbi:acyltransferase family protein [Streptomyces goshikiensis]